MSLVALLASLLVSSQPIVVGAAPPSGGGYSGVWTGSTSTADAATFDDLGTGWARVTVAWNTIEPTLGTFAWSGLDQQMAAASGGGRRTVLALVRENPTWAAALKCTITNDLERQQLASFMGTLAGRYKGVVWQLYNEEDNTSVAQDYNYGLGGCFGTAPGGIPTSTGRVLYARAIEAAAAAIHAADPTAQIATGGVASSEFVSPAGGAFDKGFLPGVLAQLKADNSLSSLDYVTVHFYSSQAAGYASAGTDLLGRVAQLRQDLLSAGLTAGELKPVISDELSYSDTTGSSNSDPNNAFNRSQRAYVPKLLARAAAADLRAAFWFWMQDATAGLGSDNAVGLKDTTGTPKPAYRAMRYFNSVVSRASQFVRRLDLSNQSSKLEGYEFTTADGRSLQLVWNQADSAQFAYVPPGSIASVTDPEGSAVTWSGSTVQIGSEPRFITYTPAPVQLLAQPMRLVDTRPGSAYLGGGQPLRGYTTPSCYALAGAGGVPATASGLILNITTAGHAANGYVTLYPAGSSIPPTSNLNFAASEYAIANSATVRIGAGGQVCVVGGPGTHLILDVVGYLADAGASGSTQLLTQPVRMVDTRPASGYVGAGQPLRDYWTPNCYTLAGVGGVPGNAAGILLNVTTTGHPAEGYATVYPAGSPIPPTSNVNFLPAKYATANSATVRLGSGGQVCAIGAPGTNLILDAVGYLTAGGGSASVQLLSQPARLVDTRPGMPYTGAGVPLQGYTTPNCYAVAGVGGVAANAVGVLLNVTTARHPGDGYAAIYPAGGSIPATSNVNFGAAQYAIANSAQVKLGSGGQVCAIGMPGAHLIIDAVGYLTP